MQSQGQLREFKQEVKSQAVILGGFIALFWFVEIVDWFIFGGALDRSGIRPRTLSGLSGIIYGPFLHGSFAHLIANTVPFLVLGWFVMVRRRTDFWLVTGITMLISGLGVWSIGPARSVHIGASGLIFGYFGFLLLRGYFERSKTAVAWAIVVIFLYGGMIWGVLPQAAGISWQGHLFGFLGGGVAAYLMAEREPAFTIRILDSETEV